MTGALHEISPFFQKLFLLFLSAFPIRTSAAPCVRAILPVTTYIFNDDNLKKIPVQMPHHARWPLIIKPSLGVCKVSADSLKHALRYVTTNHF